LFQDGWDWGMKGVDTIARVRGLPPEKWSSLK
jgi:hypothetical protein